jgi:hypothetical protein
MKALSAKDLYSPAHYLSLMAGDNITRRAFLGYTAALPLTLEALALDEEKLWENARKDASAGQRVLDEMMKGLPAAQKLVSRFYAVNLTEKKGSTTDKWAIVFGDKQLKCYDSSAEKSLRDTLKKHAEAYANSKKDIRPETLKEETERAFKFMSAELIDRAEHKEHTIPDLARNFGADAYLQSNLWGTGMPAIGIATRQFFEDKRYRKADDFKSYLLDNLTYGKASDMAENPPLQKYWEGGLLKIRIADVWVHGIGQRKEFCTSVLKIKWTDNQAGEIYNKTRAVSEEYATEMANAWQKMPEFEYLVKMHQGFALDKYNDPKVKEGLSDVMGKRCGIKYLPFNGKIAPYDPTIVMQYQFEQKK